MGISAHIYFFSKLRNMLNREYGFLSGGVCPITKK